MLIEKSKETEIEALVVAELRPGQIFCFWNTYVEGETNFCVFVFIEYDNEGYKVYDLYKQRFEKWDLKQYANNSVRIVSDQSKVSVVFE